MSLLNYRNNILYFEDVSLNEIADKIVTPMYIYSQSTLENNFNKINDRVVNVWSQILKRVNNSKLIYRNRS